MSRTFISEKRGGWAGVENKLCTQVSSPLKYWNRQTSTMQSIDTIIKKSCFNTNCANRNFIDCRPRNLKVTKKIVLIAQLIRKIWKSYFSRQTIDVKNRLKRPHTVLKICKYSTPSLVRVSNTCFFLIRTMTRNQPYSC